MTVWGSRRNVWENGASICGKSLGCVGTVGMEGAVRVWDAARVYGARKHMKIRGMVVV